MRRPAQVQGRRAAEGQDKLDQLVETAAKLFERHGYRGITVDEILRTVKFSKGGMYHRVRNKAELLYLSARGAWDIVKSEVIDPVSQIDDPEAQLRALTLRHLELLVVKHKGGLTITSAHVSALTPAKRNEIISAEKRYIKFVAEIFERLREQGKLREVKPTVAALNHLAMILHAVRWYRPGGDLTPGEIADEITRTTLVGVTRPVSPA